eukprot:jgi/Chrpa1/20016/Chrysochromulina_OHIO_Genome00025795-RA
MLHSSAAPPQPPPPPGALNLPIRQWLESIHLSFGNLYGPALEDAGYNQLSFIDGDDELFDYMMKTLRDSTGKKLPHYKMIERAARRALGLPHEAWEATTTNVPQFPSPVPPGVRVGIHTHFMEGELLGAFGEVGVLSCSKGPPGSDEPTPDGEEEAGEESDEDDSSSSESSSEDDVPLAKLLAKPTDAKGNVIKPAMSSYLHFCQERRPMLTQQLKAKLGAEFKQAAVLSQLGFEWRALPDATKAKFTSMAKSDKARYDAAFAANPANASIKLKRGGGTTRPKAPSSQGGRQQNAAVSSPRRASLHEMDVEVVGEQDEGEAAGEQTDGEVEEVEEVASDVEMDAAPAELSPTIDDAAPPAETFTSPTAQPIPVLPAEGEVESRSVRDLKELIARAGLDITECIDKADLIQRAREAIAKSSSTGTGSSSRRASPQEMDAEAVGEQDGEGEDGEQTEVEEEGEEASDAEMDAAPAELSPTIDDAAPPAETFTSPTAHPIPVLPAEGELESRSVRDLKELIARAGLDITGCIDKADLIQRAREAIAKSSSAG